MNLHEKIVAALQSADNVSDQAWAAIGVMQAHSRTPAKAGEDGVREALEDAKRFIANIRYRLSHEGYRTESIQQCIADCEKQYAALSTIKDPRGE